MKVNVFDMQILFNGLHVVFLLFILSPSPAIMLSAPLPDVKDLKFTIDVNESKTT